MKADHAGKIVLAGGSGFLGNLLARWYRNNGREVVVLTRRVDADQTTRQVVWDGRTMGDWTAELEQAAAVINLAGRSVNCRYTSAHRREIFDSRIDSTRVLGAAIARCERPPAVWLNSSTATIYQHTYDRDQDEQSGVIASHPQAHDAFSIEVATAWEREFFDAPTPQTRRVAPRIAMVMGLDPRSVFAVLRRLARWGLGGRMGSGKQYVSWIHATDFCRAIDWLIAHRDMAGPVNVVAPRPLPNAELMRLFRRHCGVPVGVPATRGMLELGAAILRTETELVLKSRRVVPRRLKESGFRFLFNSASEAIIDLEASLRQRPKRVAAARRTHGVSGTMF